MVAVAEYMEAEYTEYTFILVLCCFIRSYLKSVSAFFYNESYPLIGRCWRTVLEPNVHVLLFLVLSLGIIE